MRNHRILSKVAFYTNATLFYSSYTWAQADQAGGQALSTIEDAVTGNLGLMVGLGMVIIGLLTWLFSGKAVAGITMILGGAIFTLAPGVFNGVRDLVYGVIEQFSDGSPTTIDTSRSY